MKKLVGHGCSQREQDPALGGDERDRDAEQDASPGRPVSRWAAAAGVITSVSTSRTPTTWIASAVVSASSRKIATERRAQRHAARGGDLRVDAREEQRPVEHGEPDERRSTATIARFRSCASRDADDAAEEQVRRLGRVALVEREEEHAEAEPEREHRADRAVPLAPAQREQPEHEPDEQRAADHPEHRIDPEHERAGGAGEAELRDRVHREARRRA